MKVARHCTAAVSHRRAMKLDEIRRTRTDAAPDIEAFGGGGVAIAERTPSCSTRSCIPLAAITACVRDHQLPARAEQGDICAGRSAPICIAGAVKDVNGDCVDNGIGYNFAGRR